LCFVSGEGGFSVLDEGMHFGSRLIQVFKGLFAMRLSEKSVGDLWSAAVARSGDRPQRWQETCGRRHCLFHSAVSASSAFLWSWEKIVKRRER